MASIKSVDESSVEKKLLGAKNTQESIQSLSLWALHHKSQHDNIVRIWLNILKKSKIQRRLTLFYLCNEIVQTCKRKHAIMYKDAFKEVLRDAALLVRDASVRNNIERIFSIWEERNIYDSEFVEDLIAILNNTKIRPSAAKLLAEYKPSKVRESISSFAKLEKEIESKRRRLSSLNIDVTSQNYLKHLKDRSHGKQYTQQIEDINRHLEDYVGSLDKQMKERETLLELLEQSELFYDAQYGEAKIVTNAYKNFGTRVTNLRKKLDDVRKTLPDPLSPIPSPSVDAPSPVESVVDVTEDNTEPIDMEMSDAEDDETGTDQKTYSPSNVAVSPPQQPASFSSTSLDHPTPYADIHAEVLIQPLIGKSISLPSAPENVNSPSNSPVVTDAPIPIDYNSSFLSKLSTGGLSSFALQFNSVSSASNVRLSSGIGTTPSANDDSPSAAPEDDGGGTPVQDEKPDTAGSTVDPVALLNQLLNCTKKPASGGTDFLKSLSVLTQSMNVPFQAPKKVEKPAKPSQGNSVEASGTLQPSKPDAEVAPQFRPFYHSEDYLSVQPPPPSSQSVINISSSITTLGHGIGAVESSVSVSDSSYMSVPPRGMEEKAPLPPPPLPPPYSYSPSAYPSAGQFESNTHPAYSQHLPYSGETEFTAASSADRMEDNGNYRNSGSEGILNIRPDLVEMLKNVLNTTRATSMVGHGVPDVVGSRPFIARPSLLIPEMSSAAAPEFRSADDNGEFVERLKKKTGFSSPVNDPLTSPKLFQQMLHTGPQRMRGFPPENEFHGPNRDLANFQGHLEPTYSQKNNVPPMFDGYDSQVMPSVHFPICPQGQQPIEESHSISPMVSGRIHSELAHPEIPPRGFGPPEFLNNNERNSGNGPNEFDRQMGGNRFPEPFFNARPRFPSDFSPGNPGRPFMSGLPSRFPPMRPPPRFSQRGFYPPY